MFARFSDTQSFHVPPFGMHTCSLSTRTQWIEWEIYSLENSFYFYPQNESTNSSHKWIQHTKERNSRCSHFCIYINCKRYVICSLLHYVFDLIMYFCFTKLNINFSLSPLFVEVFNRFESHYLEHHHLKLCYVRRRVNGKIIWHGYLCELSHFRSFIRIK